MPTASSRTLSLITESISKDDSIFQKNNVFDIYIYIYIASEKREIESEKDRKRERGGEVVRVRREFHAIDPLVLSAVHLLFCFAVFCITHAFSASAPTYLPKLHQVTPAEFDILRIHLPAFKTPA